MIIDAHMHVIDSRNFDRETYERLGMRVPGDTNLDDLVGWLKDAGVSKAVCMGTRYEPRFGGQPLGEERVIHGYQPVPRLFHRTCQR